MNAVWNNNKRIGDLADYADDANTMFDYLEWSATIVDDACEEQTEAA